ncbi:hypothetical protein EVAR_46977_1 [Eumeta japonica]|uniref:Uncharacterized protein n=1 Tax=Eumeta variegata TaxID=151549 RepID=A0A4C1X594_EUMVA|nr:hypothetical protein EVAR_46977_1 [Eumeta japonica]
MNVVLAGRVSNLPAVVRSNIRLVLAVFPVRSGSPEIMSQMRSKSGSQPIGESNERDMRTHRTPVVGRVFRRRRCSCITSRHGGNMPEIVFLSIRVPFRHNEF